MKSYVLDGLANWYRARLEPWLIVAWLTFVEATPVLLTVLAAVAGFARVGGYTSQAYQAFAHGLVATLFTLGVCREWKPTGRLYTGLAAWLVVVELLAFFKLV
jgi:hypothetical protein